MKIKMAGGSNLLVKVSPSEVKQLQDDEIIIVSRAQLNAKLAFMAMEINDDEQIKTIKIIRRAINDMIEQEKKQNNIAIGAQMTVGDVKQIFPKFDEMPGNSFAQVRA